MTAPTPQIPKTIWAELNITWNPVTPGDPTAPPYPQRVVIKLSDQGAGQFLALDPDLQLNITHTIHTHTATTTTEANADAPDDRYTPLITEEPAPAVPSLWRPYTVPATSLPTSPDWTAATIAYHHENPDKRIDPTAEACKGRRGNLGPIRLENRPTGLRAASRPFRMPRPGPAQQLSNSRFTFYCAFWQNLTPQQRDNWKTAGKNTSPQYPGWILFVKYALTQRVDLADRLAQQLGIDLPLPPRDPPQA